MCTYLYCSMCMHVRILTVLLVYREIPLATAWPYIRYNYREPGRTSALHTYIVRIPFCWTGGKFVSIQNIRITILYPTVCMQITCS